MTSPWRIVLADDHAVVRAGLKTLLSAHPRCVVVGEAATIEALTAAVAALRPDLVVLDLAFGTRNALDVLPDLLATDPAPRVIVLTMHDDVAFSREAFARGAHGYLTKEAAADELTRAVETVMAGGTWLHPTLGAELARAAATADPLTPREREVLALLARGLTNAEIAEQLHVGLRTVEAHRAALRRRLGALRRADLVDAARRLGLLQH